jgi:hypothetical protein
MVQLNRWADYQAGTEARHETNDQTDWRGALKTLADGFLNGITDSTRQLAASAERFASESFRLLEDTAARAEESTGRVAQIAERAERAAEEAQRAGDRARAAAEGAGERIAAEVGQRLSDQLSARLEEESRRARLALDDALSSLRGRLSLEVDDKLAMLRAEVERHLAAQREALAGEAMSARAGVQEALAAAKDRLAAEIEQRTAALRVHPEESSGGREVIETVERVAAESRRLLEAAQSTFQESVRRLEEATNEARSMALSAHQAAQQAREEVARLAAERGVAGQGSDTARQVLDRLESDYGMLIKLVQQLSERISALTGSPAQAAPSPPQPELPRPSEPPPANVVTPSAWASDSSFEGPMFRQAAPAEEAAPPQPPVPGPWSPLARRAADAASAAQAPVPEPAVEVPAPTPVQTSADGLLEGRLILEVAPVPDFDRLLSLDGALGRLAVVRSVTLADYSKDKVTFRVELAGPVSEDDLIGLLAGTSGQSFIKTGRSEGFLQLQLMGG